MSDNSINRAALLRVAGLVRPALARDSYIPALQHICFDGKQATAYNDISALSVRMKAEIERCLPGEWLIRALQSFNGESVLLQQKDAEVLLSSGRSKLKAPTLPAKDFPLEWPEDGGSEIAIKPEVLKGIERCLLSVGNDPTHPEQMGVTLDAEEGMAVLFSSDNWSISRYETDSKIKLPGGAPVILPTFFCEQMIALGKAFPDEKILLVAYPGALVAEFGEEAKLLTKTLVDQEPADFPAMFKKHLKLKGELTKELEAIPDAFDAALQRSLLVLGAEEDKAVQIEITDDGFRMVSEGMGEADDRLKAKEVGINSPDEFHLDPALVARAVKACSHMGFLERALVLCDSAGQFVHLIAYCTGTKAKK